MARSSSGLVRDIHRHASHAPEPPVARIPCDDAAFFASSSRVTCPRYACRPHPADDECHERYKPVSLGTLYSRRCALRCASPPSCKTSKHAEVPCRWLRHGMPCLDEAFIPASTHAYVPQTRLQPTLPCLGECYEANRCQLAV